MYSLSVSFLLWGTPLKMDIVFSWCLCVVHYDINSSHIFHQEVMKLSSKALNHIISPLRVNVKSFTSLHFFLGDNQLQCPNVQRAHQGLLIFQNTPTSMENNSFYNGVYTTVVKRTIIKPLSFRSFLFYF